MPDTDSTRKRSRSPSDSEQQKHNKRANTGAAVSSDDFNPSGSVARLTQTDVTMTDASAASPSSTPGSTKSKSDDVDAAPNSADSSSTSSAPSANIHMRCLIVTQDASIIIGKGGSHVNEIREKSGARVVVSESIPGNPERILNVSGPLDAVSKVWPSFALLGWFHERS